MSRNFITCEAVEELIDDAGAWNLMLTLSIVLEEKGSKQDQCRSISKKEAAQYRRFANRCRTLMYDMEKENI